MWRPCGARSALSRRHMAIVVTKGLNKQHMTHFILAELGPLYLSLTNSAKHKVCFSQLADVGAVWLRWAWLAFTLT